tara:strand:- start:1745 stop:2593 length:849 start_codon:yes stop_codon:yes gene_type:complete
VKKIIKLIIKFFIYSVISLLSKTLFGRYINQAIFEAVRKITKKISYKNLNLEFFTPNILTYWRVDTFATKEPETLDWIDTFEDGSIFWDIGANIGLYTCYAAKKKKSKVFSFEPSIFNLEILARNIFINNLSSLVTIIPIPLSDNIKLSSLNMTSTQLGGALSTFDKNYGHDGNLINQIFNYRTIGISSDKLSNFFNLEKPDYIKLDVDGIEHLILEGSIETIKNVKSLLVEVDDDFNELSVKIRSFLLENNFVAKEKKHSKIIEDSEEFKNSFNQIWIKNE